MRKRLGPRKGDGMVYLIETADRVIELVVTPDTPGICRRTVTVSQLSGPDLSDEEWQRASAALVAELVGPGCDVHRWSVN